MHLNIYPFFSACFLLRSFLEQACACGCRLLYLMAVPCRCAIYSLLCSVVTDLCYKFLNLLHSLYLPFFFLSLPTLLQRLQFQYTQCQQSHMISKEIPAKSQSLKREIRFVCSAFSRVVIVGLVKYMLRRPSYGIRAPIIVFFLFLYIEVMFLVVYVKKLNYLWKV